MSDFGQGKRAKGDVTEMELNQVNQVICYRLFLSQNVPVFEPLKDP